MRYSSVASEKSNRNPKRVTALLQPWRLSLVECSGLHLLCRYCSVGVCFTLRYLRKMPVEVPSQWTAEVSELYEPVRTLGKGGFASVLLAKARASSSTSPSSQGGADSLVAIKVVGGGDEGGSNKEKPSKSAAALVRQQVGYAHREFEILAELSHPNIMRLLRHWEDASRGVVIMALSYAPGPTLHALLLKGGRCSFPFARVVSAQLVDAVSYLHSRAVIHRDIKPDNLVVTGASLTQSEIWDDEAPKPVKTPADGTATTTVVEEPDWSELLKKWHVTLVDFGFARALSPSDMKTSPGTLSRSKNAIDGSGTSSGSAGGSLSASQRGKSALDRSVTRRFTRMMSAVGNRAYAAPEVQRNVVHREDSNDLSQCGSLVFQDPSITSSGRSQRQTKVEKKQQRAVDVTRTLSPHVSLYGLNADAYSVGNTMLHMLTGARPDQNVNELLALGNSPVVVLCKLLCGSCSSSSTDDVAAAASNNRVVQYRRVTEIEPEPLRLIRGLTHPDPNQRTTVRTARLYPYVDDVLADRPQSNQTFKTVDYLQCVLRRAKEEENGKATLTQSTVGTDEDAETLRTAAAGTLRNEGDGED